MNLPELLTKYQEKVEYGNTKGTCAFCGNHTEKGFIFKPKTKFTAFEYLHDYDTICEQCNFLYNSQKHRTSNWVVTNKRFVFLKKDDILDTVLNIQPNEIPFMLYTTKTYKKQGWLSILNDLNYSTDSIILAWDNEKIIIQKKEILDYINKISYFIDAGLFKSDLLGNEIPLRRTKKLFDLKNDLFYIKKMSTNIKWQWCVYFYVTKKVAE